MATTSVGSKKISKISVGTRIISKISKGNVLVYSAGNVCTYTANGVDYTQEYDEGQDVLHPTVVSPSLPGAAFLGWSTSAASTAVVSSLVMGDEAIHLYAVFKYADVANVFPNGKSVLFGPWGAGDVAGLSGTWTYPIDQSKYESHTVTAAITGLMVNNNTTGWIYSDASVDGVLVRARTNQYYQGEHYEAENALYPNLPGYGGKAFTLDNKTGNLTVTISDGSSWHGGGQYNGAVIYSLSLKGKTVVG